MLFDMFFGLENFLQELSQGTLSADLLLGYVCLRLSNSTLIKDDHHTGGVSNQFLPSRIVEETIYKDAAREKQGKGHTRKSILLEKWKSLNV